MSGYWDVHCHLLPGIDDGSGCMEETMDLIAEEYKQGIRQIVFTPHFRSGMFEIGEQDRYEVFQSVVDYYTASMSRDYPGMTFYLGCEFHMHSNQPQNILNKVYCMPGEKVLLTEFSYRDTYSSIMRILRPLLKNGYRCILAHAERYQLKESDFLKLHETDGIYIQCNSDSIMGKDGLIQRLRTRRLLKKGLIDLIGSDGHNMSDRPVRMGECIQWMIKKYGKQRTTAIFEHQPQKIFEGEH